MHWAGLRARCVGTHAQPQASRTPGSGDVDALVADISRLHKLAGSSRMRHLLRAFEKVVRMPADAPTLRGDEIFVMDTVRMDDIRVVGFDFDFTLCNYNWELPTLIYSRACEYLVNSLKYPDAMRAFHYDPDFTIRGVMFDVRKGALLKLNYRNVIDSTCVFRGRRRLSEREMEELYEGRHVSVAYRDANLVGLVDLFGVAVSCLLGDVVEFFQQHNIPFDPRAVYADVRRSINFVHKSGVMHKSIAANPERFLVPSPELPLLLREFRRSGNKLFLLTNSEHWFIDAGMRFLAGEQWRELFDLVVTSARKPEFFTSDQPFRKLDLKSGRVRFDPVEQLCADEVYVEGNIRDMRRLTGWGDGGERRVLYIGDSIFSDIVEPRRVHGWTTGAIIRELEDEVWVQNQPLYKSLVLAIHALDELMRRAQMEASCTREMMNELEAIASRIRRRMSALVNPHFGSVFRTSNNPTLFAFSVQRYADLYTSKLENFLRYSLTRARFYPQRRHLPHEPLGGETHRAILDAFGSAEGGHAASTMPGEAAEADVDAGWGGHAARR